MKRVRLSCLSLRDVLTPRALLTGAAFAALLAAAPAAERVVVFTEDFEEATALTDETWSAWGDPAVSIAPVSSQTGTQSVNVTGDSWCDSGIYSSTTFDLTGGFTFTFDVNTLAGNEDRGDWDQTISIGLDARNMPSNAPCNFQGELEELLHVRLTPHRAENNPAEGQILEVSGVALKSDFSYEPDAQQYGEDFDGKWYRYTITGPLPEEPTDKVGDKNLKITRVELDDDEPAKGASEEVIGKAEIDFSLFSQVSVSVKGRSNGRSGSAQILADNLNLEERVNETETGRLIVVSQPRVCGDTVDVPINASGLGTIKAFGFHLKYDTSRLKFIGLTKGTGLIKEWTVDSSPLLDPANTDLVLGRIIGGYLSDGAIPVEGDDFGSEEELVVCRFERKYHAGPFSVTISPRQLVDDVENASPISGNVSFIVGPLPGDVNNDCIVTPEDAQLAFDCYLANLGVGVCPAGSNFFAADMWPDTNINNIGEFDDGNGVITPRDAETIFEMWLGVRDIGPAETPHK
ncbi:MAG: hypothetical protein PWP23_2765 [Candidatus Sumerlaeota bacterium]|nr:hypothetical protein [Candidatus Sumerlaeota bacterium]